MIDRFLKGIFVLTFTLGIAAAETTAPPLRMATTTSTENSGLLNMLLPTFEKETGISVHVIAVGTGKALRMGQDGDVDLVLVHAPGAEKAFVEAGYGIDRREVMYNDFVIVGPAADPAGVSGSLDATEAMRRIANKPSVFISRGDDSGTHKKELTLWKSLGTAPDGDWYREAGQGMGKVLQMAGELEGYTLTDRGTWLAYQDKSPLKIRFEGDPRLFNPYGIIAVNPARYPDINYAGATRLIEWITSSHGQELIGDFTIAGHKLFKPSANTRQVAGQ
ncbi:MAG: substrate-binding domain-containing protein [Gammaproteobacteria bacterium]|nr:substrate-binding domain-containing protein [Gammaproteobacteria bacterium]